MIDSYAFGRIVIDKIPYEKDVIVFPDRVQSGWRRKEGHLLQWEDLLDAIPSFKPEALVVGRGKFGMMRIDRGFEDEILISGITLYAENTDKAVKIFNRLLLAGCKVLGVFHLTC
jgi:hypothetical protein